METRSFISGLELFFKRDSGYYAEVDIFVLQILVDLIIDEILCLNKKPIVRGCHKIHDLKNKPHLSK
jgi:hypothetical protein